MGGLNGVIYISAWNLAHCKCYINSAVINVIFIITGIDLYPSRKGNLGEIPWTVLRTHFTLFRMLHCNIVSVNYWGIPTYLKTQGKHHFFWDACRFADVKEQLCFKPWVQLDVALCWGLNSGLLHSCSFWNCRHKAATGRTHRIVIISKQKPIILLRDSLGTSMLSLLPISLKPKHNIGLA